MRSDKWIVQIGPYRVAVDRTFDGSPAIYFNGTGSSDSHVSTQPSDHIGQVMIFAHLLPPPDDTSPRQTWDEFAAGKVLVDTPVDYRIGPAKPDDTPIGDDE